MPFTGTPQMQTKTTTTTAWSDIHRTYSHKTALGLNILPPLLINWSISVASQRFLAPLPRAGWLGNPYEGISSSSPSSSSWPSVVMPPSSAAESIICCDISEFIGLFATLFKPWDGIPLAPTTGRPIRSDSYSVSLCMLYGSRYAFGYGDKLLTARAQISKRVENRLTF